MPCGLFRFTLLLVLLSQNEANLNEEEDGEYCDEIDEHIGFVQMEKSKGLFAQQVEHADHRQTGPRAADHAQSDLSFTELQALERHAEQVEHAAVQAHRGHSKKSKSIPWQSHRWSWDYLAAHSKYRSPDDGHGGSGGHGPEKGSSGGEHDHAHADPSSVSVAIAVMLLGLMAVGMTLVYFVNASDPYIAQLTWHSLSMTVVIFLSVVLFHGIQSSTVMIDGEAPMTHEDDIPDMHTVVATMTRLVLFYVVVQFLMVKAYGTKRALKAVTHLGSHVAAFAAMDFFGTSIEYYCDSTFLAWCGVLISVAGISIIVLIGRAMRSCAVRFGKEDVAHFIYHSVSPSVRLENTLQELQNDEEDEENEFYHEQCHDCEIDFVSVASGFLISLAVRKTITNHMPPLHGSPFEKSDHEQQMLFASAILSELVLLTIVWFRTNEQSMVDRGYSESHRLVYRILMRISSMTAGWLLLFWGTWVFWARVGDELHEEDMMIAKVSMALLFSVVTFASFFVFSYVEHNTTIGRFGFRGLLSSFALLVGLSWESVANEAFTSVAELYAARPSLEAECDLGMSLFLFVLVMPAWVWYVLPKCDDDDVAELGDHSVEDAKLAKKRRRGKGEEEEVKSGCVIT